MKLFRIFALVLALCLTALPALAATEADARALETAPRNAPEAMINAFNG